MQASPVRGSRWTKKTTRLWFECRPRDQTRRNLWSRHTSNDLRTLQSDCLRGTEHVGKWSEAIAIKNREKDVCSSHAEERLNAQEMMTARWSNPRQLHSVCTAGLSITIAVRYPR